MGHCPCPHRSLWEGDLLLLVFPVRGEDLMMPNTAQTQSDRGTSTYPESEDRLEERDMSRLGRCMLQPPGWKCMASPGALHLRLGTQIGGEGEQGLQVW